MECHVIRHLIQDYRNLSRNICKRTRALVGGAERSETSNGTAKDDLIHASGTEILARGSGPNVDRMPRFARRTHVVGPIWMQA